MKKKILLVRDYSGMMAQMSQALKGYGHDVTLVSMSDSFKGNYGCDVNLERSITGIKLVDLYINYLKIVTDSKKFDIIHLQTQLLGGPYSILLLPIIKILRKKCSILSLSLAGDDFNYWHNGPQRLKYSPFEDAISIDLDGKKPYYLDYKSKITCASVENICDFLIPACFEYSICHQESKNLTTHLPFVWNNFPNEISRNTAKNDKLKIFHAVGRKGFKGSRKIINALEQLKNFYPNEVDITIKEKLSYVEYQHFLNNCDIYIDQCNSYSYGMAAVEALAKGKIVLSGAEDEFLNFIDSPTCPVINIRPSEDHIFTSLEKLVDRKDRISQLMTDSHNFARYFHGPSTVVSKVRKIWGI